MTRLNAFEGRSRRVPLPAPLLGPDFLFSSGLGSCI